MFNQLLGNWSKKIIIMKNVFLILSLTFAFLAKGQLYIKNSTNKKVNVCIGWYQESTNYTGYMTKGWYNIEPGEKIAPGLNFTSNKDFFYYYAKTDDNKSAWGGKYKLLASNKGFYIKNADMQYVKNANSEYYWLEFDKVNVTFSSFGKRTYTLELTMPHEQMEGFYNEGEYVYKSDEFSAKFDLLKNENTNQYLIKYMLATKNGCTAEFTGYGYLLNNKIVFYNSDNKSCQLSFYYLSDSYMQLIDVTNSTCFDLHGANCNYYKGLYTKTN
jgi:uncharacterized membrane protein